MEIVGAEVVDKYMDDPRRSLLGIVCHSAFVTCHLYTVNSTVSISLPRRCRGIDVQQRIQRSNVCDIDVDGRSLPNEINHHDESASICFLEKPALETNQGARNAWTTMTSCNCGCAP